MMPGNMDSPVGISVVAVGRYSLVAVDSDAMVVHATVAAPSFWPILALHPRQTSLWDRDLASPQQMFPNGSIF